MSLFKNRYIGNKAYYRHDPQDLLDEFQSYYGGRTEVFCRGKIEDYNYYDFNSLYPSVMMNKFPDPNTFRRNTRNIIDYIKNYDGCSKVDIFAPKNIKYHLLPYRTNNKVVFPHGDMTGV
jgi:hypothetical protein